LVQFRLKRFRVTTTLVLPLLQSFILQDLSVSGADFYQIEFGRYFTNWDIVFAMATELSARFAASSSSLEWANISSIALFCLTATVSTTGFCFLMQQLVSDFDLPRFISFQSRLVSFPFASIVFLALSLLLHISLGSNVVVLASVHHMSYQLIMIYIALAAIMFRYKRKPLVRNPTSTWVDRFAALIVPLVAFFAIFFALPSSLAYFAAFYAVLAVGMLSLFERIRSAFFLLV
jgi:hypothetical protein